MEEPRFNHLCEDAVKTAKELSGELTEKLVAALCARKGIAPDTAALMPFGNGAILPSTVKAVKKGSCGSAGELRGEFDLTEELGQLYANTGCGIFGTLNAACSLAEPSPGILAKIAEPITVCSGLQEMPAAFSAAYAV